MTTETITTAVAIAVAAALAVIPAHLASRKRRTRQDQTFVTYYLFGLIFLVAAIPAAIWWAKDERRRCPKCAERIRDEATTCPHCHAEIGWDELEVQDDRPDLFDGKALRDMLSKRD